jgi:tetratricopeptide (TPR) repeat protein
MEGPRAVLPFRRDMQFQFAAPAKISFMKISSFFFLILSTLITFSSNASAQKIVGGKMEEPDKSETVQKANRKLASGDVTGALKILDTAINANTDLFEAYRRRYFIRSFYSGDIDGAISDLTKALEIKSDEVELYMSRAFLKRKYKNDVPGALADYETALKYKPSLIAVFQHKADLKASMKDFDGAMAEIQSALNIAPDDIELHSDLSRLLVSKKEPDKAISHLQTFLDEYVKKAGGKLPRVKGEKIKKGKIQSESKDPLGANPVKRYSQMEFDSPEDYQKKMNVVEEGRNLSRAFIQLAKMYMGKDDFDRALASLNTAAEIDKNQEQAYGLRGVLYLSKGEYEKAIVELSSAIDIADEPYFYLNRGVAHLATANDKKAQTDFEHFLKIYPEGKPILDRRIAETKQRMRQNPIQPK